MNVGDFFRQHRSDNLSAFGRVLALQKNGACKVLVTEPHRPGHYPKAKIKSTLGWMPVPVVIPQEEVPCRAMERIGRVAGY